MLGYSVSEASSTGGVVVNSISGNAILQRSTVVANAAILGLPDRCAGLAERGDQGPGAQDDPVAVGVAEEGPEGQVLDVRGDLGRAEPADR